jgi:hypothetical protein
MYIHILTAYVLCRIRSLQLRKGDTLMTKGAMRNVEFKVSSSVH